MKVENASMSMQFVLHISTEKPTEMILSIDTDRSERKGIAAEKIAAGHFSRTV